jgi:hypothetical protein
LAHDAALHLRIAASLAESPDFPAGRRAEGLLANLAGCLLTAERLKPTDPDRSGALLDQAEATARTLRQENPRPGSNPALLRYYLLRAALCLAPGLESGQAAARRIMEELAPVLGQELRQAAARPPEERIKAAEQAARPLYGSPNPT